jgi:hypothetical protein
MSADGSSRQPPDVGGEPTENGLSIASIDPDAVVDAGAGGGPVRHGALGKIELFVAALLASLCPAWSAMRSDPSLALRED